MKAWVVLGLNASQRALRRRRRKLDPQAILIPPVQPRSTSPRVIRSLHSMADSMASTDVGSAIARAAAELQSIERSLASSRSHLPRQQAGGHDVSFASTAWQDATTRTSHFGDEQTGIDVTTSPDGRQVRVSVQSKGDGVHLDSGSLGRDVGVSVGQRSSSLSVLRALQMLQDKIKRLERNKSDLERQIQGLQDSNERQRAAHADELAEIEKARELERAEFTSTITRLEAQVASFKASLHQSKESKDSLEQRVSVSRSNQRNEVQVLGTLAPCTCRHCNKSCSRLHLIKRRPKPG